MDRLTREERVRVEVALAERKQEISSLARVTFEATLLGGLVGALLFSTHPWPMPVQGAGYGMAAVMGFAGFLTLLATVAHLFDKTGVLDREGGNQYLRFDEHGRRLLPDGVAQFTVWRYLIAIARNRVTLSQEGAAEFGIDPDSAVQLKEWFIAVGWYEWVNQGNRSGRWTVAGEAVLAQLRQNPPPVWADLMDSRPPLPHSPD